MEATEILKDLYYNNHNYDGINQLHSKAKTLNPRIQRNFVRDWLKKQNPHQQTTTHVGKKDYFPIYSETPFAFQIDLTFFPRYAQQNNGNTILFTAININTRFAYAYYSKNKDMKTILDFLKKLLDQTEINTITCDEGTEFKNKEFIDFCMKNNIRLYFVKGDSHKLGIINRFHRTIKEKLAKHFIATNSVKWIDVIDQIINNYNNSVNRGIGVEPAKVNNAIEVDIIDEKRNITNQMRERGILEKFDPGDMIRLKRKKTAFDDKNLSKYSSELFEVVKVFENTMDVKGNDGKIDRVKKMDAIISVQDGEFIPEKNNEINRANREYKINRNIKKAGVDIANIISEKRERKPKKIFDL